MGVKFEDIYVLHVPEMVAADQALQTCADRLIPVVLPNDYQLALIVIAVS